MDISALRTQFVSVFGRAPSAAIGAPGRVNLIGEHTDYNGGLVLPIAIQRRTVAMFAPRDDEKVNFWSAQAGGEVLSMRVDAPIRPMQSPAWGNYCKGVLAVLRERGIPLRGADIMLVSDIPLGGGLSSSASLEVATALALLESAGATGAVAERELALLCQKAENVYAGAPCGIMDQSIVVMAQAGMALLLDCRSGQSRHIPFDAPGLALLVADTQVKHSIGDGGYPARRRGCHQAAAKLGVELLRDADQAMLDKALRDGTLTEREFALARHVVGEIARTLDTVGALEALDARRFGELMNDSHLSLRDDFEVSCDELDVIVESALTCRGVLGARMTGGGFGGCAIVLVQADCAAAASDAIRAAFEAKFGRACPIFATRAAQGAGRVEL